jgi:putative ABC transport system ATP-binding protein
VSPTDVPPAGRSATSPTGTTAETAVPAVPPAARCEGVVRIYWSETGEVHALKGIDAVFPAGAVTAVVGPSGSGKSSLLRILGGLDTPTAGRVDLEGHEISSLPPRRLRRLRRSRIGFVFQRPSHNLVPYLSAREHVHHAARLRRVDVSEVDAILDRLGLTARARNRPNELSGGEQQRLAFAQAVVGGPAVIIADEPTAELDSTSGRWLLEVVGDLAADGTAVVLATHDAEAVAVADQTLFLHHGTVQAERTHAEALAVIDGYGRIQLPPEAARLFPDRRAVITVEGTDVRISPP